MSARPLLGGALVFLALSACGYRFTPAGGELPGGLRAVRVPMFANRTAEPGVEAAFTQAMREQVARAGREGGEASDGAIEGEVVAVVGGPAIVSQLVGPDGVPKVPQVASYRVAAAALVRVTRGGERLREIRVEGEEDYLPGTILEAEANRRLALRRLAQSLMRQAYETLAAGF